LMQVILKRGVSPRLASRVVARIDGGVLHLQPHTGVGGLARSLATIVHRSVGAAGTVDTVGSPGLPNVRPGAR
jgi:hypothetical protein